MDAWPAWDRNDKMTVADSHKQLQSTPPGHDAGIGAFYKVDLPRSFGKSWKL